MAKTFDDLIEKWQLRFRLEQPAFALNLINFEFNSSTPVRRVVAVMFPPSIGKDDLGYLRFFYGPRYDIIQLSAIRTGIDLFLAYWSDVISWGWPSDKPAPTLSHPVFYDSFRLSMMRKNYRTDYKESDEKHYRRAIWGAINVGCMLSENTTIDPEHWRHYFDS